MRSHDPGREPAITRSARRPRSVPGWRWGYVLIIALLIVSYVLCAAQSSSNPSPFAFVVQLVTVAAVLRVTEAPARVQQIAWLVLSCAGAAIIVVAALGTRGQVLDVALSAASILAFLVAPVAIIRHQVTRRGLDIEALLAATAAYILVGMSFTFVYNLITLLTVTPIFGAQSIDSLANQLFFSFTTLTTTGYGNIVPASATVQGIAVAEAITGQLFLITAVARIMRGSSGPAPFAEPQLDTVAPTNTLTKEAP